MTQIALVVHVLGILLWVGGTITAGWTAAGLVASGETKALSSVRSALLAIGAPGILLAFAGGLAQLISNWSTLYAHAGWMHGKLTIGLVLAGLHGMLIGRVRKAATGEVKTPGVFMGIAVAYAVLALVALGLLMFRPGA